MKVVSIALIFCVIQFISCNKNKPPRTPSTPSGFSVGLSNNIYGFTTITTDPNNDGICYRFDWGNEDTSGWSAWVPSGLPCSLNYIWLRADTYYVKAQAKDVADATSSWSKAHQIIINPNPPNTPTKPYGPSVVGVNSCYDYSSSATDPNGDSVSIRFDWGDGDPSQWSSFVPSGDTVIMSHAWSDTGSYYIKAQAQNKLGEFSNWSESLLILVRKNRPPNMSNTPSGQ
ncbi:MAG: hypothetical protein OEW70_05070 [candidate division WOR-3 bacterium]|nr:hypothetical protein [candidate division WOR-3 bacterium]